MEGEAGDLVYVVIQRSNHGVILHVLLRCLIHHHLTYKDTKKTVNIQLACWIKNVQCALISNLPHLNRHSTLGQHALSVQDLDGGVSRAGGDQLAITTVRSDAAWTLVGRYIAGLIL